MSYNVLENRRAHLNQATHENHAVESLALSLFHDLINANRRIKHAGKNRPDRGKYHETAFRLSRQSSFWGSLFMTSATYRRGLLTQGSIFSIVALAHCLVCVFSESEGSSGSLLISVSSNKKKTVYSYFWLVPFIATCFLDLDFPTW